VVGAAGGAVVGLAAGAAVGALVGAGGVLGVAGVQAASASTLASSAADRTPRGLIIDGAPPFAWVEWYA
jgi:hypothetical protein